MNRYKLKPGTTITDIKKYAEENKDKCKFGKGGWWIAEHANYYLMIDLYENVSVNIAFSMDLENWDDFDNVLVLEDTHPYSKFYYQLRHPEKEPSLYLKIVIKKYDEIMDSLPFLENIRNI